MGFRSLFDVSKALFVKLWWKFRTTKSPWSKYMWNKYCKKEIPIVVQFRQGSHVWRKMLEAREEVEHDILWEMNRVSTNIWHENWTGLGALYDVVPLNFPINEKLHEVAELRDQDSWNDYLLEQSFPIDIADRVRQEVHFNGYDEYWDTPKWMPTASERGELWKRKIPTDDRWKRNGYIVVSKCWCCLKPKEDTFQYLFLTSDIATRVWKTFIQPAGIVVNMVQAVPSVVTWELWKRRNTMKNGGSVSCNRVIHEWPDLIKFLEVYKPYVVTKRVIWQFPFGSFFKCNRDGASRGNPGPSSYSFCVRDCHGDLVYARANKIGETTNIVAEAKAIAEGLAYCVEKQLYPLIIETDSLTMKKIIEGEWDPPWCIGTEVRRIKEKKEQFNIIFQHVLWEGNIVANYLANLVFSYAGKTLINQDKAQIPNLRIRIAKKKHQIDEILHDCNACL
ncbi:uncharacterized protein LOC142175230 [Nicotiana tabacum]|uniref:Uncharacterized protein LOC142175230 n=1 Tax=Nicotiana tabacum TaxID=4097 RepID=A0AC58TL07_TOBAC